MAFILTASLTPSRPTTPSTTSTTPPHLSQTPISRRAALKLAAFSLATWSTSAALAQDIDVKELKEDIKELEYDEEVTEVGPDPAERNVLRTKKKEKEPEYRAEEKELLEEEEKKYDAMLAKEAEEDAAIKAKFSK